MKNLTILKIGGEIVDEPEKLNQMLEHWAKIPGYKILVHGGGKQASIMGEQLGIKPQLVDGRRITDAATLDVVTMVYAGLLNKQIVAQLQSLGCNALGLTGADANLIPAQRRKATPIDFGFVGDLDPVQLNTGQLILFLESGLLPVFCAITHDGKGQLLNTNTDTIASVLAIAFKPYFKVDLILCLNQPGVLADPNDPQSLIEKLSPALFDQLKQNGVIKDGMIPKLDAAFEALANQVDRVIVGSPELLEYFPQTIKGTELCRS